MLPLFADLAVRVAVATCTNLACPGAAGCDQQLGPASINGEDAQLGYDINVGTGNMFYDELDIDLEPALGPDLRYARYYNSQNTSLSFGLGNGWTHTYSWQASIPSSGTVKVVRDSGRAIYFTGSGPSSWTPQTGEFGTLTGIADAGFTYTTKYGDAYTFDNTTAHSGRLLSIAPPDNTAITVSYSTGTNNIATVSSGNQSLTFAYSGTNISSVTDPAGNVWSYSVAGGNLASATLPNNDGSGHYGLHTYTYTNVTVDSVIFSNGGDSSALTEVQELQSAGTTVTSRLVSYNASHRAVRIDANYLNTFNADVQLSYTLCTNQPSTTTATLSGGSKTITSSQTSGFQRMTALTATAGVGAQHEWASASYAWNASLTLSQITDGNGNVKTYNSYDTVGNPTSITEASGTAIARTTTYTYHPVLSRPLTATRMSVDGVHSHVITYDYDSTYTTPYNYSPTNYLHQIVDTGYTDVTLSGAVTSPQTYTTQLYYDGNDRITSIVEPNGHGTTLSYWPTGSANNASFRIETVAVTGLSALAWSYNTYDLDGRLLQFSDPNGVTFTSTFDPVGQIATKTVAQGATSLADTLSYNLAGDLTEHATPDGTSVVQEFNAASQMWRRHGSTTTPSPVWAEIFDFNSVNQVVATRRFSGGLGTDPGTACAAGDPGQFCVSQANDAFSRLSSFSTLTSSDGTCAAPACAVTFGYDDNGNPTARYEANANLTTYGYDQLNRINKITLPTGYYSTLTYDINGNLASRRDPRDSHNGGAGGSGRLTTYVYDDFGRPISVTTPDLGSFISNYDGSGLLASALDGNGTTIAYTYDDADRLVQMHSSTANDTVNYSYDETGTIGGSAYADTLGRVSSILGHDPNGNVINIHYIYDLLGRVASELDERGPSGSTTFSTTSYGWGSDNELTSLTYPDGEVVTYGYPALTAGFAPIPLPQSVSAPYSGSGHTIASSVAYFSDGVASGLTYGNGDTRALTRNKRGEVTLLTSGSTGSVVNQTYSYDARGLGNLTSVVNFSGLANHWTWGFGYDVLNRLTSYSTSVRGGDSYSWTYDEVGNRLTHVYDGTNTTYTYDAAKNTNQVLALSGGASDTWTYTAGGQVLTHYASGITTTHNYDSRQLLTSDTVSGVATATYTYDGLGQRWSKNVASTGFWTDFYYDVKGRILQEYGYNGASVNGANAYDIVDHIYLGPGAGEVGRVVRRYEKTAPDSGYAFVDMDLEYVHEYRGGPFGIENGSALAWEAEVDPFDNAVHVGLPGTDGKIGTADDTAATITNNFGGGGTYRDAESEFVAGSRGNRWRGNVAALGAPQPASVLDRSGATAYGNNGHVAQLSTLMQPIDLAAAGALLSGAVDQLGDGVAESSGLPPDWSTEELGGENDIDPNNAGSYRGPFPWQNVASDDYNSNSIYANNGVNDYASLFSSTVAVNFAATSQLPAVVSLTPGAIGAAMGSGGGCPPGFPNCDCPNCAAKIPTKKGHLPKGGAALTLRSILALATSQVGQLPALGYFYEGVAGSVDVTSGLTASAPTALSGQSPFLKDPRQFSELTVGAGSNFNININLGSRY